MVVLMARHLRRQRLKDKVYLRMALEASLLSTCPGGNVGAVLVRADGSVASVGVNGAPRRTAHCSEVGCSPGLRGECRRAIHAEQNALHWARELGSAATMYVTRRPCVECIKDLIQRRVKRVVTTDPRPFESLAVELLVGGDILVECVSEEELDALQP